MKTIIFLSVFFSLTVFADSKPIIGGRPVEADQAKGVINLYRTSAEGEIDETCTGTKIGERFILTAAHCVLGKNVDKLGWSNSSTVDLNNENETIYGLYTKKVHIHPSYELGSMLKQTYSASDIAIIEIDESQGNHLDKFRSLPTVEIDYAPVKVGEEVQIYGYGCEGTGQKDSLISKKKMASVEMLPEDALADECEELHPIINQNASGIYKAQMVSASFSNKGNASVCEGDSGGPTMRNGKIVGVNSSYLINQKSPVEEAFLNLHSRISEVQTWVNSIVN